MPENGSLFVFDEFVVDPAAFELRRSGEPVAMEPQVFEVLLALVENAGRVMTKDELFDRVWPDRYVTEAALNSRVMSARKALGDSGQLQRYIKTVHGRGYRFVGEVQRPEQSAVPGRTATPPRASQVVASLEAGTSFVGRRNELARLIELLQQPSARLVTVVGPGGMGKTRLMCEAAAAVAPNIQVDAIMLEHAAPGSMALEIAAALGMQARDGDPAARWAGFFGGEPRLLVLDNVEHLGDEAREVVSGMLRAAPALRIACTSRETLRLRQEWVLPLDGLEPADARDLFLDRAARANGGPLAVDSSVVDRVCELVGYLPLAVELAAALTMYVDAPQIASLIERDAGCLATDLHDVPERHRSMLALFEATCSRLDDGAKGAMGRLSFFEGGFDSEAAAEVSSVSLPELRALAARSLLQVRGGRFTMHPLFRQFAREHAVADPEVVRTAHARHYMALAGRMAAPLQGAGQLEAAETLDVEAGNLLAAWRWAVHSEQASLLQAGLRGLACYLIFRGRFLDAEGLLAPAVQVAEASGDPELISAVHVTLFFVRMRLGKPSESVGHARRALAVTREYDLPWQPGFAGDGRIAATALHMGAADYEAQYLTARECRDMAIAAGDRAGQAFSAWLAGAGLLRCAQLQCRAVGRGFEYWPAEGNSHAAEAAIYFREAHAILDSWGEAWLAAYVAIDLGVHAVFTGSPEAAAEHYRRAFTLREQIKDPQGMGSALVYLADVLCDMDRAAEALEILDQADVYARRAGDAATLADSARARGIALVALGDLPKARSVLLDALQKSASTAFTNNILGSLRVIAELLILEGRVDEAVVVLHAVEADPGTTPASKAKARLSLQTLGNPAPLWSASTRELVSSLLQHGGVRLTPVPVAV